MANSVDSIDKEAREQIKRLERRLEGAHLTPGLWQIAKQVLQSVFSWTGWEVFGIGLFILFGIFLIVLAIYVFSGVDADREVERQIQATRRYQPTCEALGMTLTEIRTDGHVICTGTDRIISVNPSDLNHTEIYHLDSGETTRPRPE